MLELLESRTDTVPFISSIDKALAKGSNWDRYRDTGDESALVIEGIPTKFKVRALTQPQKAAAVDFVGRGDFNDYIAKTGEYPITYVRECARYCVAGIEGAPEEWPKPITVRERGYTILSREVVDRLPNLVCYELFQKSKELEASEEDRKN